MTNKQKIQEFRERFGYSNLVGVERVRFEHQAEWLSSTLETVYTQARKETINQIRAHGERVGYNTYTINLASLTPQVKEECSCHCHHTAQYIGQEGYGMQPNYAECPRRNCTSSCFHCQPEDCRDIKCYLWRELQLVHTKGIMDCYYFKPEGSGK